MVLGLEIGAILSFLMATIIIEVTPGPNMTYLALVSASDGRRAGFRTVAGIALGLSLVGVIAAVGLAEAIQNSKLLYELLRWFGVAFMLYLAWDGWRSSAALETDEAKGETRYFTRGLLTNLMNPKAGLFYISVLPTFMNMNHAPLPQALLLTSIYVGVATIIHSAIVAIAGSIEPYLNSPTVERRTRRVLSALLAGVAIWFGWTSAR